MPDFGSFRGFGEKLVQGQTPTQLGLIGSVNVAPPLLDTYPTAAAAYSLRKLRTAYTGSAIRVRRTDLTESDIGFNANGNLDTTALLAFTGTGVLDNGFVTTWYDQSGNGHNATQTTAINQPQIVSSGSVILENSKPSIEFIGANSTQLRNASLTTIDFKNATSFIVISPIDLVSTTQPFNLNINPRWYAPITRNDGNTYFGYNLSAFALLSEATSATMKLYTMNADATNVEGFTNSVSKGTVGSAVGFSDRMELGASDLTRVNPYSGFISECIVYNFEQSSNRTGIESNINDFYTIY